MDKNKFEIYTLIISGIAVLSTMVLFILYFVIRYQRKQRQYAIERENAKIEFDSQLMKAQLEIQEQTMKMISQEIHDNIGQMLSLAKLNLALAKKDLPDQPRITDSHNLISNSIHDLRNLAHSLDKEYLAQQELHKSLQHELELIDKTGVYKTDLIIFGSATTPDKQKELILFRIVQESLHNIIKHANASHIRVTLTYESEGLKMEIADNGIGFLSQQQVTENNTGSGIGNMSSRASLIGAKFNIDSILHHGTKVSIFLPNQ